MQLQKNFDYIARRLHALQPQICIGHIHKLVVKVNSKSSKNTLKQKKSSHHTFFRKLYKRLNGKKQEKRNVWGTHKIWREIFYERDQIQPSDDVKQNHMSEYYLWAHQIVSRISNSESTNFLNKYLLWFLFQSERKHLFWTNK